MAVHFTTPCGFEVWLIHLPETDTTRIRAFFSGEEIDINALNGRLSREGTLMLRDHIDQLYGGNHA
jgi:hypothetical protein